MTTPTSLPHTEAECRLELEHAYMHLLLAHKYTWMESKTVIHIYNTTTAPYFQTKLLCLIIIRQAKKSNIMDKASRKAWQPFSAALVVQANA